MEDYTLIEYHLNKLTLKEREKVDLWLKGSDRNQTHYQQTIKLWESSGKASIYDKIAIPEHLLQNTTRSIQWKQWLPYAALLAICISLSIYFFGESNKANYELYANLSQNPTEFTLFDGSKITLKPQAKLYYTDSYTKDKRLVKLDGEAFFEIAKDKNHPFEIEAGNAKIKVLGTSFLVKTTLEETSIDVSTGLVEFAHLSKKGIKTQLSKGESATLNTNTLNRTVSDVNKSSWKTGIFDFKDIPLESALDLLNDYYSKPIILRRGPRIEGNITAYFDNENQEDILEILKITCNLEVVDQGNYFELKANHE